MGARAICSTADALGLSRPATGHLVDLRHKRIEITAIGAQLIDRVDQAQSGEFEEALAKLPEPLQAELARTLSKVIAQLESTKQGWRGWRAASAS